MDMEEKKPMYSTIADDLRYKIKNKIIASGDKLPGELELADQHGVSRITSKKALDVLENEGLIYRVKGSGSYVSSELDINRKKDGIDMISTILPFSLMRGGGMDMLHGVESVAKHRGFYVSLHNSNSLPENERKLILELIQDGVKGIIYYPILSEEHFDLIKILTMNRYPIVMIDKHIGEIPIDSVVTDNFGGSQKMTRYLIENGHKNIGFVSVHSIHECSSIKERFLGYCKAMDEANIMVDIDQIWFRDKDKAVMELIESDSSIDIYQIMLENLLKKAKSNISAIQAVGDEVAIGLINAARKMGIKVPEDLSIVGFDDLDKAGMVTPQLTTIKQDFFGMGVEAARLAIDRINNPQKAVEQIKLPAELIIRKSVLSNSNASEK